MCVFGDDHVTCYMEQMLMQVSVWMPRIRLGTNYGSFFLVFFMNYFVMNIMNN